MSEKSNLTSYDEKILAVLDTVGGLETGDVAKKVTPQFGCNARQHSGAIRSWLLGLEKRGLVRRLDDQKPVCWVKMELKTESLNPVLGAGEDVKSKNTVETPTNPQYEREKQEIYNLEVGTTFRSPDNYLVSIDRIWVEQIHFPNPTTMIAYSYKSLSNDGKPSGNEKNALKFFIENILGNRAF